MDLNTESNRNKVFPADAATYVTELIITFCGSLNLRSISSCACTNQVDKESALFSVCQLT